MDEKKIISLHDLEKVTKVCLDVLNYTEYLSRDPQTADASKKAKSIFKSLRKLFLATEMYNRKLICISGLQGAGKTTLMKNFYGINDNFLDPTIGRGERIPVLITEKNISSPALYAIKILKDKNGSHYRKEVELRPEDYTVASAGKADETMYLELKVPYRHTNNDGVSFVLLPGYESKNDYWNTLIEFAVNSSDAAVFVFNETSFSNAQNEKILTKIQQKFGENVVYAISNSDVSIDDNSGTKKTCLEVLQIPNIESDRVICAGSYNDQQKNEAWIKEFKEALEKYAYRKTNSRAQNSQYILEEILDIKDCLREILDIVNDDSSAVLRDHHNEALLKAFDRVTEKKRKEFQRNLNTQLEIAKSQSIKELEKQFAARPKSNKLKQILFGNTVEQFTEARETVENALKSQEGGYLPEYHIVLALQKSLSSMDRPQERTNLAKLIETTKNDKGQVVLASDGESTVSINKDISALLVPGQSSGNGYTLQCTDHRKLMRAVAEMATYYYMLNSYDENAQKVGLPYYELSLPSISYIDVLKGAESSKKFAVGVAGMMGLDLVEDGALNFAFKIAEPFGVAAPVAGVASVAILGVGAATAIMKDINRMQREDFLSAKMAVESVYDELNDQALEQYMAYMEKVRDTIEENIDALDGNAKKVVVEHNTKIIVNHALDILDQISGRYSEERYGLESFIS